MERALKMIIAHDIAEAITGDLPLWKALKYPKLKCQKSGFLILSSKNQAFTVFELIGAYNRFQHQNLKSIFIYRNIVYISFRYHKYRGHFGSAIV